MCIKADGKMPTENVLVERVNASGVGLTIGSIGAHTVCASPRTPLTHVRGSRARPQWPHTSVVAAHAPLGPRAPVDAQSRGRTHRSSLGAAGGVSAGRPCRGCTHPPRASLTPPRVVRRRATSGAQHHLSPRAHASHQQGHLHEVPRVGRGRRRDPVRGRTRAQHDHGTDVEWPAHAARATRARTARIYHFALHPRRRTCTADIACEATRARSRVMRATDLAGVAARHPLGVTPPVPRAPQRRAVRGHRDRGALVVAHLDRPRAAGHQGGRPWRVQPVPRRSVLALLAYSQDSQLRRCRRPLRQPHTAQRLDPRTQGPMA